MQSLWSTEKIVRGTKYLQIAVYIIFLPCDLLNDMSDQLTCQVRYDPYGQDIGIMY